MTFLPPMRSASMLAGSRHMEPLRTAADDPEQLELVSPNLLDVIEDPEHQPDGEHGS